MSPPASQFEMVWQPVKFEALGQQYSDVFLKFNIGRLPYENTGEGVDLCEVCAIRIALDMLTAEIVKRTEQRLVGTDPAPEDPVEADLLEKLREGLLGKPVNPSDTADIEALARHVAAVASASKKLCAVNPFGTPPMDIPTFIHGAWKP